MSLSEQHNSDLIDSLCTDIFKSILTYDFYPFDIFKNDVEIEKHNEYMCHMILKYGTYMVRYINTMCNSRGEYIIHNILSFKNSKSKKISDYAFNWCIRYANVNCTDKYGDSPLHYACLNTCYDKSHIKMLLSKGADINVCNITGETPLHCLVSLPNYEIDVVRLLLKSGANPNIIDNNCGTPLHQVCFYNNDIKIIQLLLKYNANPTITNKNCGTPLDYAIKRCYTDIIKILLNSIMYV